MGTLATCGATLRDALRAISGLHADFLWPDLILPPHAVVLPGSGSSVTFDAQVDRTFTIILLGAAAQDGTYRGQENCLAFMEEDGASSIRAVLEDVSEYSVRTTGWRNFDALRTWQGRTFWGALCDAEVLD
jgi:hypothetical protein